MYIYIYVRYVLLCTALCITHCISPYVDSLLNHLVYIVYIVYALYCMHCILYCIHICITFFVGYWHTFIFVYPMCTCLYAWAAIAHIFMYIYTHIYDMIDGHFWLMMLIGPPFLFIKNNCLVNICEFWFHSPEVWPASRAKAKLTGSHRWMGTVFFTHDSVWLQSGPLR